MLVCTYEGQEITFQSQFLLSTTWGRRDRAQVQVTRHSSEPAYRQQQQLRV